MGAEAPQEPRQHLVILARAERPQGPVVCAQGSQFQAGTTEGSGGGPGAGSCSCNSTGRCRRAPGGPWEPQLQCLAPHIPPSPSAWGLLEAWPPCVSAPRLVGDGDHVTRLIPAAAWARRARMCWAAVGVRPAYWAAPEHTGLCHPRNVFDQEFLPRGGKPRATNPFPQSQRPAPSPEPRRQ